MLKTFITAFSFLLLFCACSFNPKVVDKGDTFLQGTWEEDSVAHQEKLVNYEKYHFKFTCDSFYLIINSFSKVNLNGGDCYNKKSWREYAKGTYFVKNDTLMLNGVYVDKDFRYKPESACYRYGKNKDCFTLIKSDNEHIRLHHITSNIEHLLTLKEKSACKTALN